jgi:ParB family chromosome partitioning protein
MEDKALGKGLSALISEDSISGLDQGYLPKVKIENIIPNRYQPRAHIKEESIKDLMKSIKEHGVIEPLIVTRQEKNKDKFELIAGERRLKAAQLAGLTTVPVVVKEATPQQMLELAVVENIQRADLNPLEEGLAFKQLIEEFGLSHGDISDKVGLSRPAVANKLRLLALPDKIKEGLLEETITEGHARALLGLSSEDVMLQAYKIVLRDNLSVRAVEELVRRLNQGHKKPQKRTDRILDHKTLSLETELKKLYTPKLTLARSKRGGKIVIPFKNDSELDRIYQKLTGQ